MTLPSFSEWLKRQREEKSVEPEKISETKEDSDAPAWLNKLNETTTEALIKIKGIGPKIAEKILSNRPYASPEGIPVSPQILERIKSLK
jgi:DNA uptake protein ComE-like DNA-binding protein